MGPDMDSLVAATDAALSSKYRLVGPAYGTGMQVAHLLKCLKRKRFDDSEEVRLRRHLILTGPPGAGKSSCSQYFLRKIAGCADAFRADDTRTKPRSKFPHMAPADSSSGWERLRGTVGMGGDIMPPILQRTDWLYASELMSFLGHNQSSRLDKMENMNRALEEGGMAVMLTKMGNMDIDSRREMAKKIPHGADYDYDPEDCILSFDCHFSFMGATRFLDPEVMESLTTSGYIDRHSMLECRPTEHQIADFADDKFGPEPPAALTDELRARNLDAWRTIFTEVEMPPRDMVKQALSVYNAKLRDVCQPIGVNFGDVISGRDDGDIIQLITAAAVDRIISSRPIGTTTTIDSIEYQESDMRKAVYWSRFKLLHMQLRMTQAAKESKVEAAGKAVDTLRVYCNAIQSEDNLYPNMATAKEFIAIVMKNGVARATAYRHLNSLLEARAMNPNPHQPEVYTVDSHIMSSMGFRDTSEEDEAIAKIMREGAM